MLKPKIVYYRKHKKSDVANFLKDVKNYNFSLEIDDPNKNSEFLTSLFINMHL